MFAVMCAGAARRTSGAMSARLFFSQPCELKATQPGAARQPASSCASVHVSLQGICEMSSDSASVFAYFHQ